MGLVSRVKARSPGAATVRLLAFLSEVCQIPPSPRCGGGERKLMENGKVAFLAVIAFLTVFAAFMAVIKVAPTVGVTMPPSTPTSPQRIAIADEDMAEIIKLALAHALVDKKIPDYHLIKDPANIVLCTENIDSSLVPKISGVNLMLLKADAIQEKADREGDFLYLCFKQLKFEDSKVTVYLDNVWAKSKETKFMYISGGGLVIEYHKEFGSWIAKEVHSWIS